MSRISLPEVSREVIGTFYRSGAHRRHHDSPRGVSSIPCALLPAPRTPAASIRASFTATRGRRRKSRRDDLPRWRLWRRHYFFPEAIAEPARSAPLHGFANARPLRFAVQRLRSARLARISLRMPPQATIHDAAPSEPKRSLRRISAIAAGRASIRASVTSRGSRARLRRSSTPSRLKRSRPRRGYRLRLARGYGPVRKSRTRGIGMACSH